MMDERPDLYGGCVDARQKQCDLGSVVFPMSSIHHSINSRIRISREEHDMNATYQTSYLPENIANQPITSHRENPAVPRTQSMEHCNIDNLLGYGPQWISKAQLRKIYRSIQTDTRTVNQPASKAYSPPSAANHTEGLGRERYDQPRDVQHIRMPKVVQVLHSYVQAEETNSLVIDTKSPVGRNISSKVTNEPCTVKQWGPLQSPNEPCTVKQWGPLQSPNEPSDKPSLTRRGLMFEADVYGDEQLTKYCQWFDSLSSSIFGNKTDDFKSRLTDVNGTSSLIGSEDSVKHDLKTHQMKTTHLKTSKHRSDKKTDYNDIFFLAGPTYRTASDSSKRPSSSEQQRDLKGTRRDEVPATNKHDNKNGHREQCKKIPEEICSEHAHHGTNTAENNSKREGNELLVNKLVSMAKDYADYREKRDKATTVKNKQDDRRTECKRRKKIDQLKRLVTQQEKTLAKLKEGRTIMAPELTHTEHHHDDIAASASVKRSSLDAENEDSLRKKTCLDDKNSSGKALKKRWLNTWSVQDTPSDKHTEDQPGSQGPLKTGERALGTRLTEGLNRAEYTSVKNLNVQ